LTQSVSHLGVKLSSRQMLVDAIEAGDAVRFRQSLCLLAPGTSGDQSFVARELRKLAPHTIGKLGLKARRVHIARSVTVEPLVPYLVVHAALAGLWLVPSLGSYASFLDDLTNPQAAGIYLATDTIILLADSEDLAGGLREVASKGKSEEILEWTNRAGERLHSLMKAFRKQSPGGLVVQGFMLPFLPVLGPLGDANIEFGEQDAVRALNKILAKACKEIGNAVFFDQDQLGSRVGRAKWRDMRMFLSTRLSVSASFFGEYAGALAGALASLCITPRKVVCTDLDDTLWGGVLGEDGPNGIQTGHTAPGNGFFVYQQYLRYLSRRGILIAAVSKNNENDVREAFRLRGADIGVTLNEFVSLKIDWVDKPANLLTLADELSLGLESFVFIDDNPVECAAVKQNLPQVMVIQGSPAEPWKVVETMIQSGAFDSLHITEEDCQRGSEYKAQKLRADLKSASSSKEEFLASLGITCTILPAASAPLSRTVQLLGRTNQFNLTTRRHTDIEVGAFARNSNGFAIAIRVRDRFGDAGVSGVALAECRDDSLHIESLLISCRVMGRGIETAILARLAKFGRQQGMSRIVGEFVPTEKNSPCADFYPRHGFTVACGHPASSHKSMFYSLEITERVPIAPYWISVEDNDLGVSK
jgi:FkbH-like protein